MSEPKQMNYYREYIIIKTELRDAKIKLAGANFELSIANQENQKMRAKTEHLTEYVNDEIKRLQKMIKNLSYQAKKSEEQAKKWEKQIKSIDKKHSEERECFVNYYQKKIDERESNRLHFERVADVNRIAVLEFENKHLQAEVEKLTKKLTEILEVSIL